MYCAGSSGPRLEILGLCSVQVCTTCYKADCLSAVPKLAMFNYVSGLLQSNVILVVKVLTFRILYHPYHAYFERIHKIVTWKPVVNVDI